MAKYIQTSTDNPYGHRPWQASLYTTFGDFGWLKQPQNAIDREPAAIRPRIRKPPELSGVDDVTVVGGSGRVLFRGRRSRLSLGAVVSPFSSPGFSAFYQMYGGRVPTPAPCPAGTIRTNYAGPSSPGTCMSVPVTTGPVLAPITQLYSGDAPPMPIRVLPPPSNVPAPPAPVVGPGGQIYLYRPGAPGQEGSPFPPTSPPPASAALVPQGIAPASTPPTDFASQISAWLQGSMIAGIPNVYLVAGAGLALLVFSGGRKKGF